MVFLCYLSTKMQTRQQIHVNCDNHPEDDLYLVKSVWFFDIKLFLLTYKFWQCLKLYEILVSLVFVSLCASLRDAEDLLATHKKAWSSLWNNGRVDIEGDLELAQAVHSSMYYILSSTRMDWAYGLSPGGLPGGEEYMGHTFWDQEIWMYPPLVLLHPELARSAMRYRHERLPAARRIAEKYGYKG
mgnify:CR=1 FL=1